MQPSSAGRGGRPWYVRAAAAGAGVLAAVPLGVGGWASPAAAAPGDGSVTVRVVREVNGNGSWDQVLEPGMSGVSVTLTDDAGAVVTGVTAADGTVSFTPATTALTGGRYRVQVINPKPGVLFSAFAAREGLAAAPNRLSSTEEFVDVSGGKNIAYTTALWNPADYCQKNATLVTACIRSDLPRSGDTGTRTLVSFPYNARGTDNQTTDRATKAQTGAVYGIGYSKPRKWVFSGAHAHRGSAYGPGGPGGIYLTDMTSGVTSLFATVPNAGSTAHDMNTNQDVAFAAAVAKQGLGDVEVSEDGADLYTVNLFDRRLYRYDATQPTAAAPKAVFDIPPPDMPCPAVGDWRPYGLGVQDGVVYVGGTCSGQSTQNRADLRAIVRTFDPVSGAFGSVVLDQKLDYPRQNSFNGATCPGPAWYPWNDTITVTQDGKTCNPGWIANPEPILADIIVDTDGSLILGFRDRYTDQIGQNQVWAAGSLLAIPAAGGALSRACPGGGIFVMAENRGCGKTDQNGFYDQQRAGYHNNAFYAGAALSKVETTIATSAVDPTGALYTGGTGFVNRDGTPAAGLGNQLTTAFGKGGSMADLEVLCDEAPLQIGNRVWYDVDKDGIQDPGEKPVPGATVHLYDQSGAVVGTMTTTARGEYYFDDANVTGGLKPHTTYTIKIDNPADYASGGPLYEWVVTANDAGGNDFVDSDGTVPPGGRYPQHTVTTGGPGQDNHTYDFGYHQPDGEVRVLKQDTTGQPLAGAVYQLWKDDNGTAGLQKGGTTPDTAVGGLCTTGADGLCAATVPLGSYYWEETAAPDGYLLPDPAVFGPATVTLDNYRQGVTVTAVDQLATGEVTVRKQDTGGGPLPGAVFQLWRDTDGTAGLHTDTDTSVGPACTTGVDGLCTATVPLGSYFWQETAAPDGYLLPDPAVVGPLQLTMANRTQGVTVTATNELATGEVRVRKTDQSGTALPGAVFQLWQETNGTSGLQPAAATPDTAVGSPCTTPAAGTCTRTVPLGAYYWQEITAPAGYLLPDPAIFGPLLLTLANRTQGVQAAATNLLATGEVRVVKHDPAGTPLGGAVFQLWRETNTTTGLQTGGATPDTATGTPCTTSTDGTCTRTVPLGSYYWQETAAPPGYLLPDPAVFGPLELTMANRDQGVQATAVDELAMGEVRIRKRDPDGNPLDAAVFQLWRETNGRGGLQADSDAAQGVPCTTGTDGTCAMTVPLGSYYWQETRSRAGYTLPDPAIFGPLEVTMDNRDQGVEIVAVNRPAPGQVRVVKHDRSGNPLPGAVFQLWRDSNGTAGLQPDTDTPTGPPCTTGTDGTCTATVELGRYYWQETAAPAGYLLPDPAVFGPLDLTMANRDQGVQVTAVNAYAPGEVRVLKQDPNGTPLPGAVFQLWRETNGTAGLQPDTDTPTGPPCTTAADGTCTAAVELGTYYWQETAAPAGYQLPDPAVFGPLPVTVGSVRPVTVTATNKPKTGQIILLKTDNTDTILPGAVFQLWRDTNGHAGLQPDDTTIGQPCTTGVDGRCTFTPLPLGTYYLVELQAPPGHLLPTTPVNGPYELTDAHADAGNPLEVVLRNATPPLPVTGTTIPVLPLTAVGLALLGVGAIITATARHRRRTR